MKSSRSAWGCEMSYAVVWSLHATEDFMKLEKKLQERIMAKLDEATENPKHYFSKLTGGENISYE